jgi:hypothetical protein
MTSCGKNPNHCFIWACHFLQDCARDHPYPHSKCKKGWDGLLATYELKDGIVMCRSCQTPKQLPLQLHLLETDLSAQGLEADGDCGAPEHAPPRILGIEHRLAHGPQG